MSVRNTVDIDIFCLPYTYCVLMTAQSHQWQALESLLCFAPQELQSKGNVVYPAFGMNTDIASEEWRIKEV